MKPSPKPLTFFVTVTCHTAGHSPTFKVFFSVPSSSDLVSSKSTFTNHLNHLFYRFFIYSIPGVFPFPPLKPSLSYTLDTVILHNSSIFWPPSLACGILAP